MESRGVRAQDRTNREDYLAQKIGRRALLGTMAFGAARPARAATPEIRIGVLTEFSGPNASSTGVGSVIATKLAADDFKLTEPTLQVEILESDHQAQPDIALAIARRWLDQGVDVITNLNNSAAALAVSALVRERNRVALLTAPASSDFTGRACGPNHVHWTYDTWALGNGTGRALVEAGGKTWFFIGADYTFGHLLADDTGRIVREAGGSVLGAVFTPYPGTTDFSAFLLQAQASGAQVVALANSGTNTTNCIKQAHEFGLTRGGTRLAALLMTIIDVDALGLEVAEGLVLTAPFYWDFNDGTRTFSRRFAQRQNGRMPTMLQAGDYSATTHYLKTVQSLGPARAKANGRLVVETMKALPVTDPLFGPARIRADGRLLTPMHVFQVKSPAESHYPWDYYRLLRTIPAEAAFRPMMAGLCPMVTGPLGPK